jgi:ribonuclease P protein component
MLPASRRIRRKDFKKIFSQGAYFSGVDLSMTTLYSPNMSTSRFAFSISKKIAKGAVLRNFLRRKGYNAIKEFLPKITHSFFVVFVYKRVPEQKDSTYLKKQIEKLLQKAKLLH